MAGATLEFRFQDEEVRAMARRFREQLARVRFKPLLTSIGNELITSVSRRFETGTAPDGSRWARALRIPGIGFRRAVHHPGGTIPARPYLGLSDTDERVIQDLTEDWLRKKLAKMRP